MNRPASSKLARSASCRSTSRSIARDIFSAEISPVKRRVMDSLYAADKWSERRDEAYMPRCGTVDSTASEAGGGGTGTYGPSVSRVACAVSFWGILGATAADLAGSDFLDVLSTDGEISETGDDTDGRGTGDGCAVPTMSRGSVVWRWVASMSTLGS